jgi:hypothetical protein
MKQLGFINATRVATSSDWHSWQGVDFDAGGKGTEQIMLLGVLLSAVAIAVSFFSPEWAANYLPREVRGIPYPFNIFIFAAFLLFCGFAKANYARRRRSALPILSIGYEGVTGYKRLGSKIRNTIRWTDLHKVKFSYGAVIFFGYKDSMLPGRESITSTLSELDTDQKTVEEILKHFSRGQWPKH